MILTDTEILTAESPLPMGYSSCINTEAPYIWSTQKTPMTSWKLVRPKRSLVVRPGRPSHWLTLTVTVGCNGSRISFSFWYRGIIITISVNWNTHTNITRRDPESTFNADKFQIRTGKCYKVFTTSTRIFFLGVLDDLLWDETWKEETRLKKRIWKGSSMVQI